MSRAVSKIIFPAAGMGTRFLPATKATPKEMLTIVDRPLIQYAVEEALAAGMDDIIMVTGRGKRAIEDHFDISAELEAALKEAGKDALYEQVSRVSRMANVAYIRQKKALGLGHAVLCAASWVADEPFGVALADELILGDEPAMLQLSRLHRQTGASVIGLMRMPRETISHYGVVEHSFDDAGRILLHHMVEKPLPEEAPSDLAIIGRYIFTSRLMDILRDTPPGKNGEIQLTDAISKLAEEEPVYGLIVEGERFDAGNPLGFLLANSALGLRHPEYGTKLKAYLHRILGGGD